MKSLILSIVLLLATGCAERPSCMLDVSVIPGTCTDSFMSDRECYYKSPAGQEFQKQAFQVREGKLSVSTHPSEMSLYNECVGEQQ